MDSIVIRGGRRLAGAAHVSGAKNAALPLLAAAILTDGTCIFKNVPLLNDIATMKRLLRGMGAQVDGERAVRVTTSTLRRFEAPYDLVKTMRASVLVLCPLVARFGQARVSLPGGCAIGARPIDQHIKGLELLGATIRIEQGYIVAEARRLRGTRIVTD